MARAQFAFALYFLACLCGSGCGSAKEEEPAPAFFQLKLLNMAYMQATESLDHGPRSKDELMPFLMNMGEPAEALRSAVERQDFVIHWGVDYRKIPPKDRNATVLAYEKESRDGKRHVLCSRNVTHVTDEQLSTLQFPPGYKRP